MDAKAIQQIVDQYIEELKFEFVRFSEELMARAEGAEEEIEAMGLPKELFLELVNPQELFRTGKMICSLNTERMLTLLQGLDPAEEKQARNMIVQELRSIHDELSS